MRHRQPFSRQAADFALRAQREQASMRRELSALRDSLAGLRQAIRAPVPAGGSRYTKYSRSGQSPLNRALRAAFTSAFTSYVNQEVNYYGGYLKNAVQSSFYTSSAQSAQQFSGLAGDAQRIS